MTAALDQTRDKDEVAADVTEVVRTKILKRENAAVLVPIVKQALKEKIITSGVTADGNTAQDAEATSNLRRSNAQRRAQETKQDPGVVFVTGALKDIDSLDQYFRQQIDIGNAIKKSWKAVTEHEYMRTLPTNLFANKLTADEIDKQLANLEKIRKEGADWKEKLAAAKDKILTAQTTNPLLPKSASDQKQGAVDQADELVARYYQEAKIEFAKARKAWETFNNVVALVDQNVHEAAIKAWLNERGGQLDDIDKVKTVFDTAASWLAPFLAGNRVTGVIFRVYTNVSAGIALAAKQKMLHDEVKTFQDRHVGTEAFREMDKNPLAIATYVMDTRNDVLDFTISTIQNILSAGLAASPPGVYEICLPITDVAKTVISAVLKEYFTARIEAAKEELTRQSIPLGKIDPEDGQIEAAVQAALNKFGVAGALKQLRTDLDAKIDKRPILKAIKEYAQDTVTLSAVGDTVGTGLSTGDDGSHSFSVDPSSLGTDSGNMGFAGSITGIVNWFLDKIIDLVSAKLFQIFPPDPAGIETAADLTGVIDMTAFDLIGIKKFIDVDIHQELVKSFKVTPFDDLPNALATPYSLGGQEFTWHRTDSTKTLFRDDPDKIEYYVSIYYSPQQSQAENKEVWGYYSPVTGAWRPDRLDPTTLPNPAGDHGWPLWDVRHTAIIKNSDKTEVPGKWYHVNCEASSESYCLFVVTDTGQHRWATGLEHAAHSPKQVSNSIFNLTDKAVPVSMIQALEILVTG